MANKLHKWKKRNKMQIVRASCHLCGAAFFSRKFKEEVDIYCGDRCRAIAEQLPVSIPGRKEE